MTSSERPLTRSDLDKLVCGCGALHGPLVFRSACHMSAPTWVQYDKDALPGVLEILCSECDAVVGRVRVAGEG